MIFTRSILKIIYWKRGKASILIYKKLFICKQEMKCYDLINFAEIDVAHFVEVIQHENAFVITLVEKKNVLFTNVSIEVVIFTLFGIAALIYKAPNLKLTVGFLYISLKMVKLTSERNIKGTGRK